MADIRSAARALGGDIAGPNRILCPGPGHSRLDRSLSVTLTSNDFVVHSFAGNDFRECRDHVKAALGLERDAQPRTYAPQAREPKPLPEPSDAWLRIWRETVPARSTIAQRYLQSRHIDCEGIRDIRFHHGLRFDGTPAACMVALYRDIHTDQPCGIHRTFISDDGKKLGRKMFGRAKGAAIKLSDNASVTYGLHIGEGVETCLAAMAAGFRPVWALGSAGAIASFPVLAIDALTILGERDESGANERAARECAERWDSAGHEVAIVQPMIGNDLNDVVAA